ncbi:MAG: sensor histidine kinase [Gammaproteobacteria bacterium]
MFKINSLYAKLAIGLATSLLLVGLFYTLFVIFMAEKLSQSTQQNLNQHLAAQLVADKKIVHEGRIDKKAMKQTFMQYMTINPSIEIYYLDLAGNIISYSAEPGKVKRESVSLAPIQAFINGHELYPLLGDDPRAHDRQKPFSVTPIPNENNPQGYLYVVLQGEEFAAAYEKQTQNTFLTLSLMVLAGSLLLGLFIGLFVFNRLTLRLKHLQDKVKRFANDDFQNPAIFEQLHSAQQPGDEIAQLQDHIATMGQHITRQWKALKQQDKLRRDMVANISHDLRTPLAALQGYLETISLKGDAIDEAEKNRYLSIAIRQTQHLQKLIENLFELAKLEAREQAPEFETFSILELIYDVVNKFSMQADAKHIEINIDNHDENPLVMADIGLIERVLDNLLQNAIHYTPDDGAITIRLEITPDHLIRVLVCDSGPGINDQQQPLIFERFHQAHSPERSSGHAGLGLAIVKKIIDLHRQSIWVESQPGNGSVFNFTLASAE